MKIIGESSSSRTEWAIIEGNKIVERANTQGLNPFFQSRREISHSIRLELPASFFRHRAEHVYFYCAGASNADKKKTLAASIIAQFKTPTTVESDLLGAARGLLIKKPGIACILGIGSNSCYYDGKEIVKNVPAAGYILGDDGAGSTLGKHFLGDCLKGLAPADLTSEFYDHYNITPDLLLDSIYMQPMVNHTLCNYSFFLANHKEHEYVHNLITYNFRRFFERNILQYDYEKYPICFVGSVATAYSDLLHAVAAEYGIKIKKIANCPMPGLAKFHSEY